MDTFLPFISLASTYTQSYAFSHIFESSTTYLEEEVRPNLHLDDLGPHCADFVHLLGQARHDRLAQRLHPTRLSLGLGKV